MQIEIESHIFSNIFRVSGAANGQNRLLNPFAGSVSGFHFTYAPAVSSAGHRRVPASFPPVSPGSPGNSPPKDGGYPNHRDTFFGTGRSDGSLQFVSFSPAFRRSAAGLPEPGE